MLHSGLWRKEIKTLHKIYITLCSENQVRYAPNYFSDLKCNRYIQKNRFDWTNWCDTFITGFVTSQSIENIFLLLESDTQNYIVVVLQTAVGKQWNFVIFFFHYSANWLMPQIIQLIRRHIRSGVRRSDMNLSACFGLSLCWVRAKEKGCQLNFSFDYEYCCPKIAKRIHQ